MNDDRKVGIWFVAIFLVLVVVLAIGASFISSSNSSGANGNFKATTVPPIDATDHTTGDATSTVSVVEYGDFECPACGAWEPLFEQLQKAYGSKVVFVFRNFPLYQIHPNAEISADAAEAAGLQGKYWEMHNLLYAKQNDWSTSANSVVVSKYFDGYAQSLGLDVTKFNTDINSSAVKARVQRDLDSGNAAQIDHTPTFFINLKQIQNPSNYAQFQSVLDAAIASSTHA